MPHPVYLVGLFLYRGIIWPRGIVWTEAYSDLLHAKRKKRMFKGVRKPRNVLFAISLIPGSVSEMYSFGFH